MKHYDTSDEIIFKSIVDLSHQIKDLHEELFLLRCELKKVKNFLEARENSSYNVVEYKRS